MDTNHKYKIMGLIFLNFVVLVILFMIWFSSGFSFEGYRTYAIYMQESVWGLALNSTVEFNGVDVGEVAQIKIDPTSPQIVELLIKIKNSTPITQGTVAMLSTRGITGMVFLALKDKSLDLRPLHKEKGQKYPIIKTTPSIFLRFDAALSQISSHFNTINQSIQSLLNKENLLSIKSTLFNMKEITHQLVLNSQNIDTTIKNTATASVDFLPFLQSSTISMQSFSHDALPSTYRLLLQLDHVTKNLSEALKDVKRNPAVLVRGMHQKTNAPGESTQNNASQ